MRLDQYLVAAGLSPTRSQAREAILRGAVTVNGIIATRAGQKVGEDARVIHGEPAPYASRAAHKLAHGLDHFAIDPSGAIALDVGASTGGFTDVLLRRCAARVIALDVGRGQLAPTLAADERVSVLDGVNARHLDPADLPYQPDLIVSDVSFISLTLVLPAVLGAAAPSCQLLVLVKPQFEVGPENVGKGGVVRDQAVIEDAIARVEAVIAAEGLAVLGRTPSPIQGAGGNREFLVAAKR
ncbi:MAG: TlyA family RNA methyltransferase [Devosia sp.]